MMLHYFTSHNIQPVVSVIRFILISELKNIYFTKNIYVKEN